MILSDDVINEWEIYSAEQFQKEFKIEDELDETVCDEEYITHFLEKDKRKFRVTFMESARGNAYEEYWKIQEVK